MNNYEKLNIPNNSNLEVIKKAFRNLAKQYHPDKNCGDTLKAKKFIEIKNAYEELLKGNTGMQPEYNYYTYRQYQEKVGEFRIIGGKTNKDGSFTFRIYLKNCGYIVLMNNYYMYKKYNVSDYYGNSDLNISESDLKMFNYNIRLNFIDLYGNGIIKEYKIKKPLNSYEKFINYIKNIFK